MVYNLNVEKSLSEWVYTWQSQFSILRGKHAEKPASVWFASGQKHRYCACGLRHTDTYTFLDKYDNVCVVVCLVNFQIELDILPLHKSPQVGEIG